MKFVLLVAALSLAALTPGSSQEAVAPLTAEQQATARSIFGYYELKLEDGNIRRRFISDGRWMITQYDAKTGVVIYHHGGTYVFDGKNYIESVEYANESTGSLIGNKHQFVLTVKPNSIHIEGVGNPWNEEWERVKDDSFKKEVVIDPAVGKPDSRRER